MQIKQIGIDSNIVLRRQFTRSRLIAFFKQRTEEPLKVAFEACSGAHWLAHQLMAMGHDVQLLTPESVRPFAKAQKNDWNDALAIAEAAQRPGRHSVGIKSQEQLDIQALHRVRQRLVTARTAVVNQVRGLLRERGLVFGSGRMRFERFLKEQLVRQESELNPVCRTLFATLADEYEAIDTRIEAIDAELAAFAKSNSACRALLSVPGVGVIVATAVISAVASVSDFRSGRDLAAFLGLVPRQRSTGGKATLLGISKRGNTYVRTLLIHGMRSAFYNRKKRENRITAFMERLVERGMHTNKIVVASANKAARVIWALLTHNTSFRPNAV
jgi:transposase